MVAFGWVEMGDFIISYLCVSLATWLKWKLASRRSSFRCVETLDKRQAAQPTVTLVAHLEVLTGYIPCIPVTWLIPNSLLTGYESSCWDIRRHFWDFWVLILRYAFQNRIMFPFLSLNSHCELATSSLHRRYRDSRFAMRFLGSYFLCAILWFSFQRTMGKETWASEAEGRSTRVPFGVS